jgi:hypothetical protein
MKSIFVVTHRVYDYIRGTMASYSPIPRPGSSGETKKLQVHENHVTPDDSEVSQPLVPRRKRSLKERLGSWVNKIHDLNLG